MYLLLTSIAPYCGELATFLGDSVYLPFIPPVIIYTYYSATSFPILPKETSLVGSIGFPSCAQTREGFSAGTGLVIEVSVANRRRLRDAGRSKLKDAVSIDRES